jgi:hypothetical protein
MRAAALTLLGCNPFRPIFFCAAVAAAVLGARKRLRRAPRRGGSPQPREASPKKHKPETREELQGSEEWVGEDPKQLSCEGSGGSLTPRKNSTARRVDVYVYALVTWNTLIEVLGYARVTCENVDVIAHHLHAAIFGDETPIVAGAAF